MPILVSNDILTELVTKAACPRCGYGLRGIVESWTDACPLTGVCSECGLEIEWKELLNPSRAVPRWCVEYGRWWWLPITATKTLLVLFLRPRKFWRDLKMYHEPRWRRFSACLLMTLAVLYPALAVHVGMSLYCSCRQATMSGTPMTIRNSLVIGLKAAMIPYSGSTYPVIARSEGPTAWSPSGPFIYAARFKPMDVFRHIRFAIRINKFVNPRRIDFWHSKNASVFLAQVLMITILSPISFLVLPQSLRKAKVRYRHLVRIGLYSLHFSLIPCLLILHHQIMGYWTLLRSYELNSFLAFYLPVICLNIWWSLAAKHYLKLPHAWGVGVSMVVLAYAGGLFIVSLIDFVMI